jgi:hypothetical protein
MGAQPIRPLELMDDPNITQSDFTDFIGVWENFVPKTRCEALIKHFENVANNASVAQSFDDVIGGSIADGTNQFPNGSLGRKDESILLNYSDPNLNYEVNQYLTACVQHYVKKYDQLKHGKYVSEDSKMQKTKPGGGYHVWHYESAGFGHHARELVWIIYLNDMPDGEAETEFLYQRRRIKPTVGTVVVWPAGMTHVHKGNTVFTQDKYILTGWYIKVPN